jgi:acetylornithine/N-succinyldiaminopimelate aminotransferase
VPCAAALANLAAIDRERLLANVTAVSAQIRNAAASMSAVQQVHGHGFLVGLELDRPAAGVQQRLWERRILTGTSTDPNTLRLLPPLSFSSAEADMLLAALSEVLK